MFSHILTSLLIVFNLEAASVTSAGAGVSSEQYAARYKSHSAYKHALSEYKRQNYEKALGHIENSLELFPRNKKSKELLAKIYQLGTEYYKTGVSLVHFDRELAMEYLKRAKTLMPPDDKKAKAKITTLLKQLERDDEDGTQEGQEALGD